MAAPTSGIRRRLQLQHHSLTSAAIGMSLPTGGIHRRVSMGICRGRRPSWVELARQDHWRAYCIL